MAIQRIVLLGSGPNSGQGDNLYTAFDKINNNFTEIYNGSVAVGTSGLLTQFQQIYTAGTPTIAQVVLGSVISQVNAIAATTITNNLAVTGVFQSTGTNSGALTVAGGVGIGGNLNVLGNVSATNILLNGFVVSTSTGFNGGTINSSLIINTTTVSVSTSSGALIIKGGLGIGGTLNANAINATSLLINGVTISTSTIFNGGSITNPLIITSNNGSITTSTGALQVSGGIGVGRNITLGYDGGYVSAYFGDPYSPGANSVISTKIYNASTGSSAGVSHTLVSNVSTLTVHAFSSNYSKFGLAGKTGLYSSSPNGMVIWESVGNNIQFNVQSTLTSVLITSSTNALSTTTATLVINGGAGIGKDLYVGGTIYGTVINAVNSQITNLVYATSTFSGSYSDGTVVDYATGNGRISVGPADNLTFYSGGPNTTATMVIGSTGSVTLTNSLLIGTQTVFTNAGVSVGPISYFTGVGTIGSYTISNSCQYFLINSTFTSMTLYMPANPISGQVVEISTRFTLTGLTHVASPGQYLSGGLSSTPLSGTGGKWVYFTNASTSTWFRLDKAV